MISIPANTDIFIVGAGPAGATLSLFLSKKKIAHTIVDAAKFPRDKICGDGLDLKAVRVLTQLDPEIVEKEMPANPFFQQAWGARAFTSDGRDSAYLSKDRPEKPNRPLVWTIKRLHFDDFLVKKISGPFANLQEETKVTALEKTPDGWKITTQKSGQNFETRAKLLIGADGDHSIVLRMLGDRQIDRRHYAGTIRIYHKNVGGFHPSRPIEAYMPPKLPMSYFYMFPLANNEANVGFGMVSEFISRRKVNLREAFLGLIKNDPVLAPRFEGAEALESPVGYGIPFASRRRKASGEGWLLIGDAASLVSPLSGEGIGTGMISGLIAADFIERAVETGDFSQKTFKNFDREIFKRLRTEILLFNSMRIFNPFKTWDWAVNNFTHSWAMRFYFNHSHREWLKTGYERPLVVEID